MQVTVEDQSSVKKTLHIEIPEDRIAREIDKAYAECEKISFKDNFYRKDIGQRQYKMV